MQAQPTSLEVISKPTKKTPTKPLNKQNFSPYIVAHEQYPYKQEVCGKVQQFWSARNTPFSGLSVLCDFAARSNEFYMLISL